MFKVTVWTDFEVPSSRTFDTEAEARQHGERAIRELGCSRFSVKRVG